MEKDENSPPLTPQAPVANATAVTDAASNLAMGDDVNIKASLDDLEFARKELQDALAQGKIGDADMGDAKAMINQLGSTSSQLRNAKPGQATAALIASAKTQISTVNIFCETHVNEGDETSVLRRRTVTNALEAEHKAAELRAEGGHFFAPKEAPHKKSRDTSQDHPDDIQVTAKRTPAQQRAYDAQHGLTPQDDVADAIDADAREAAKDERNHDGTLSVREAAGAVGATVRALGSERKRATAKKHISKIAQSYHDDDRRGMRDGSLAVGRGFARITGSQDVGAVVTEVVGDTVTKTNTLGHLVTNLDGGGLASAAARNLDAATGGVASWLGMNSMENALKPLEGQLNNDRRYDWKHLVNAKNEHQFEIDGNGKIEASEIVTIMRNNGITFEEIDKNKDGKFDYREVGTELLKIARKNHAHNELGRMATAVQKTEAIAENAADKAMDFALSKTALGKELLPMLADFQRSTKNVSIYDRDHDGKVELHEAVGMLRQKGITDIKDVNHDGKTDIKDVALMWNAKVKADHKGK